MKTTWSFVMFVMLGALGAFAQGLEGAAPAESGDVPLADPFVLLHEGVYYAYGTGSPRGFPVYTSRDLVSWEKAPRLALDMKDSYGTKKFWAPEVVYRRENQTFYLFYTAEERLCVATSKSPLGPFKQVNKQPLRDEREIDSTLFVDDDGTPWLFFVRVGGGQNVIWAAELERDWLAFKTGEPVRCIGPERNREWESKLGRVTEGPSVFKHGGLYYLMYSANDYKSQDYAVGYATAASPRGPWKKADDNPVLRRPRPDLAGTGHGAPFFDRDGNFKYVFHAHASLQDVQPRKMYIIGLAFDKKGRLSADKNSIITPRLGKSGAPSPAPSPAVVSAPGFRAASDYSARHNGLGELVMQDGRIIFEEYHKNHTKDSPAHVQSGTKGFWGPVVSLMIQEGLLQGYDQRISDILTEWRGTPKQNITIRQAMELSSGLVNNLQELQGLDAQAPDLFYYAVNTAPLLRKPGAEFQYGPVNYYVMGAVMQRVLDKNRSEYKNPLKYLEAKLLEPLGIHYTRWAFDKAGNPHMPNGAFLTLRNWIKWGRFVLQKGEWEGKQLVRRDLMEELFKPSKPNSGYGLCMWLNTKGGFGVIPRMSAPSGSPGGFIYHDGYTDMIGIMGAGPNRLYMIPSLNMVVARQTETVEMSLANRFVDHEFLKRLFAQAGANGK